ncbi:hypothetical protein Tco_0168746 [Tanacetum coccineum]
MNRLSLFFYSKTFLGEFEKQGNITIVWSETVKLQILYWMTYIEYGWSDLQPEAQDGMVVAPQNINNTTIISILQQEKLTRPNFTNWYRNLRIVLRTLENYKAYDMIQELKTVFEEQAKQELFETVKAFYPCKQEEGQSVSSYLLKMKSYLDALECLGYAMPNELGVHKQISNNPYTSFGFVMSLNDYRGLDVPTAKLFLIPTGKLMVPAGSSWFLLVVPAGLRSPADACKTVTMREEDVIALGCFIDTYYFKPIQVRDSRDEEGRKKRRGAKGTTNSGHHARRLVSGENCCLTMSDVEKERMLAWLGLIGSRKLKHGALSLYMGNKMRVAIEAIRSFDLILPSGLIIVLDNCHFAPTVTRGVVSISRLVNNGYPKETMGYYFYYPLENKIFVSRNTEFFENSFMVQETSESRELLKMSGSDKGLEIIQEEDIKPTENTSKEHNEVAPIGVEPQSVGVPIRRSARISQVPNIYGYYVDSEEYELGDLNEPPNYKVALANPESDKWLKAINTKMQSMKDN